MHDFVIVVSLCTDGVLLRMVILTLDGGYNLIYTPNKPHTLYSLSYLVVMVRSI
jgi:hypothetical protein